MSKRSTLSFHFISIFLALSVSGFSNLDHHTTPFEIDNEIDIKLVKSVDDLNPNVGDVVTYTLELINDGSCDATGVAVEDLIPNGLSNISNISNGGVFTSGMIEWIGLTVAAGTVINLTYNATVEAPLPGIEFNNVAQVTAHDQTDINSEPDNDDGDQSEDDEDSVEFDSVQVIDLELTKTLESFWTGDSIAFYSIRLRNLENFPATGVVVEDVIPNGLTNVTNISFGGVLNNNIIEWSNLSISPGGSRVLSYEVTVQPSGLGVDFQNIAQVTQADQFDTDSTPDNDDGDQSEDDEDSVVFTTIDLELTKTVSDLNPTEGDIVTYIIEVSNAGPGTATNVGVEDLLGNGLTNASNISNEGQVSSNVIEWGNLTIPPNETITLSYQVTIGDPNSGDDFSNAAQVSSADQPDIDSEPFNDDGDQSEDDEDSVEFESVKDVPDVPELACYEYAIYDPIACDWIIEGEQPDFDLSTLICTETAEFDDDICEWVIIPNDTDYEIVCEGYSLIWAINDSTYTEEGLYTDTTEIDGNYCTVFLNLTTIPADTDSVTTVIINEGEEYFWPVDGMFYSGSGSMTYEIPGCNSSITIVYEGPPVLALDEVTFYGEYDKKKERVNLTWLVDNEDNINQYTVERSVDNPAFGQIEIIEAQDLTSYSYVDNNLTLGTHYYRLKVDRWNGDVDYSDIISIDVGQSELGVTISPNPTQQQFTVTFDNLDSRSSQIAVYNNHGKLITIQATDQSQIQFDSSQYPSGVYIVQVRVNDRVTSRKLIIL